MADSETTGSRKRHTTGITGLDEITCGGLLSGSVYIIRGTPGAGKTIISNQICHHWAAHGEQCLYFTLLSESHDRLIENLQDLAFFSSESLERIHYQSGFHVLENEGLKGILRLLIAEANRYKSCLIVLDGLFVLQEQVDSERDFRLFMNQLQNLAHITGSTILLLTNSDRGTGSPEYTMVDGWLELAVQQLDYRVSRFLQVQKLRGSNFIDGQHVLCISSAGVKVFPRIERLAGPRRFPALTREKYTTGISELDHMLSGGVRRGSCTLLAGPSGIGKTSLGLHFLAEANADAPGLYFGFYEGREDLMEKASVLGLTKLEQALESGVVDFVWHAPTEHRLDELAHRLINTVQQRNVKRLLVDGIDAFRQAGLYPERMSRFFSAINNILRNHDVTAMFTLETPHFVGGEANLQLESYSAISQNIILLRYVEINARIERTVSIVKTRNGPFDNRIRRFEINEGGITMAGHLCRHTDLTTGHAHTDSPEATDCDE